MEETYRDHTTRIRLLVGSTCLDGASSNRLCSYLGRHCRCCCCGPLRREYVQSDQVQSKARRLTGCHYCRYCLRSNSRLLHRETQTGGWLYQLPAERECSTG